MNFKSLRAFQLVAERGSLSAAARELCLSQPAVSRLIAQLEAELSLRLFDRSARRLATTSEGQLFYDTTKQILAGLDEIPRIAREIKAGERQLHILATPRIAQSVISPALALLRKDKKVLRSRVEIVSRDELVEAIATRHFDLAFASLPVAMPVPYQVTPLMKVRIEAAVPKDHRLASRPFLTAGDLAGEELIGPWQDAMWRQEMGEFLPAGETPRQWVLETHSSIMACQMAVDGAGIAFLDRLSARGLDTSGVTFKPLNPQKWITFGFIRRDVGSINPNVESFISSLHRSIDQLRTGNPEIKDCVAKLDSGYGLVSQA